MLDLVSDVAWNPRYNMFAMSGFGQQFPVLVFVYQRSQEELNTILMSGVRKWDSKEAREYLRDKTDSMGMSTDFGNSGMKTSPKGKGTFNSSKRSVRGQKSSFNN